MRVFSLIVALVLIPSLQGCSPESEAPESDAPASDAPASAAEASPDSQPPSLLFVQSAPSGSLQDSVLILDDIGESVLWFTDRPDRGVGHLAVEDFVALWDADDDGSFGATPPNAAVSFVQAEGEGTELTVVTLRTPRLEGSRMQFVVDFLEAPISAQMKTVSVLIDNYDTTNRICIISCTPPSDIKDLCIPSC